MFAWRPWRPEEVIGSPETGVMDGFKLSCECWEPNSAPLQEQQLLTTTEPSPQALEQCLKRENSSSEDICLVTALFNE